MRTSKRVSHTRTTIRWAILSALLAALLASAGCGTSSSTQTATPPPTPAASAEDTATAEDTAEVEDEADDDASVAATYTEVDQTGANNTIRDGARVICVDTKPDAEIERLSSASIVPLASLTDYASAWRKTDPVLVTSRTEAKSRSAAGFLTRDGFTQVFYLGDGHDGDTGPYTGTDPRVYTNPPVVYFFWEDPEKDELNRAVGQMDAEAYYDKYIAATAKSMDELASEYNGIVEFRYYEWFSSPSTFENAWDSHDDVIADNYVPQWVLVDQNGDKIAMNGFPWSSALLRVYSFCERAREAAEEPDGT